MKEYKTSVSSRMMNLLFGTYYAVSKKTLLDNQLPKADKRKYVPKKTYMKETFNNIDFYSVNDSSSNKHIFYLHGGAYVLGGQSFHFSFLNKVHRAVPCSIHYVDYPLAPASTVMDTVSNTTQAIRLFCEEHNITSFSLFGDSAGAGLSLTISTYLEQQYKIEHLFLISPWLDLTVQNLHDTKDPILSMHSLQTAAKMYAPGQETSMDASPINMEQLTQSKITVVTSTRDILHKDALRFYEKYPNVIDLHIYKDGMHDCALFPFTKEQQTTIQLIKKVLLEQ